MIVLWAPIKYNGEIWIYLMQINWMFAFRWKLLQEWNTFLAPLPQLRQFKAEQNYYRSVPSGIHGTQRLFCFLQTTATLGINNWVNKTAYFLVISLQHSLVSGVYIAVVNKGVPSDWGHLLLEEPTSLTKAEQNQALTRAVPSGMWNFEIQMSIEACGRGEECRTFYRASPSPAGQ
jgi:hypothetical protein